MSTPFLGEIISWDSPSEVEVAVFTEAMKDEGFEDHVPKLRPQTALNRSLGGFKNGRVIKKTKTSVKGETSYQFTAETKNANGEFEYTREAGVSLDVSGNIVCNDKPELITPLQESLKHKLNHFTSTDVTKAVQKALNSTGDLFQLKNRASFYFVPKEHVAIVEKVEKVLDKVNGKMIRFPIGDSKSSGAAVKEAIADAFEDIVGKYEAQIEDLDIQSARGKTVEGFVDKLKALELKSEGYKLLLTDAQQKVTDAIERAKKKLKDKVNSFKIDI
jgi:hypothetical protein